MLSCPSSSCRRLNYALITFQLRTDEECEAKEPMAVITVIHLPDEHCSSPAVTLSQFLKFNDNRLLKLKVGHFISLLHTNRLQRIDVEIIFGVAALFAGE